MPSCPAVCTGAIDRSPSVVVVSHRRSIRQMPSLRGWMREGGPMPAWIEEMPGVEPDTCPLVLSCRLRTETFFPFCLTIFCQQVVSLNG